MPFLGVKFGPKWGGYGGDASLICHWLVPRHGIKALKPRCVAQGRTTSFPNTEKKCKYPTWALNRVKMRCQNPNYNKRRNNNNNQQNNSSMKNSYMVVPYYQGLSESIKRSCKKYGV